ncbi:hypothetical protein PAEVO_04850 [Paenibacillus sp. GM2FR]|nr:hypothetical protein PAEVO_04850 [Paenibacillus sp. GM2FR]
MEGDEPSNWMVKLWRNWMVCISRLFIIMRQK